MKISGSNLNAVCRSIVLALLFFVTPHAGAVLIGVGMNTQTINQTDAGGSGRINIEADPVFFVSDTYDVNFFEFDAWNRGSGSHTSTVEPFIASLSGGTFTVEWIGAGITHTASGHEDVVTNYTDESFTIATDQNLYLGFREVFAVSGGQGIVGMNQSIGSTYHVEQFALVQGQTFAQPGTQGRTYGIGIDITPAVAVPEPGAISLLALLVPGFLAYRRRSS